MFDGWRERFSEFFRLDAPPKQAKSIAPLPDIVPGLREHAWPNPWRPREDTAVMQPQNVSGLPTPGLGQEITNRTIVQ